MRRFSLSRAPLVGFMGVALLLIAACGTSSKVVTPPPTNGYDFSYHPNTSPKTGGTVVIGDWQFPNGLSGIIGNLASAAVNLEVTDGLWSNCIIQLPDFTLGLNGWKPDECTEVPTVANGDESADGLSTTFKLDPKAKWSDGQPITADDYMLNYNFAIDPNIGGAASPYNLMKKVTKVDDHTVKIDWTTAYAPYLTAIWNPVPLHTYNAGAYAGLYNAATGKYDATIAAKLVSDDMVNTKIAVDNGGFTVQSFAADDSIVLVKNPNYFSNFFKGPFLDKVIFKTTGDKNVLIQAYKAGQYDHVEDFLVGDLPKFADVPMGELIASPAIFYEHLEFNQRPVAPNAKLNGGTSIFTDQKVRQAFVQAFDRCSAIKGILGVNDCSDPSIATNEITTPPSFDFDPTVKIPAFDLTAASALLDTAGYKIVKGKRMMKDGVTPMSVLFTTTTGNPLRDSFIALMRQSYLGLNIQVTSQQYSGGKLFNTFDGGGILATGQYDISLFAFINGSDPDGATGNLQSDQIPSATNVGGGNYSGLHDSNVDAQLAAGRQTLDQTSRVKIYHDLQKYITSQSYFEPLYIRADYSLTKTTLGNYKQFPTSVGNQWNMVDWYTAASS